MTPWQRRFAVREDAAMTTIPIPTGVGAAAQAVDVRTRTGRADALRRADEALTRGERTLAEAIARRVLACDIENADAYAILQVALVESGKLKDATVTANHTLAHFRALAQQSTQAYMLHVLQQRGFAFSGVLDIGAYEGEFSILARQFFSDAAVLMVEPQPQKRAGLDALATALGGDVRVESVLLGDEDCDGRAFHQLRTPFGSTGSSLYEELSDYPRDVLTLPMRRLDSLVRSHEGRVFDLVKIDVQGAELDVLRGASAMIGTVQALCIELSLHPVNRGAPLLAEVVATLDQMGFAMCDAVPLPRDGGLQKQIDAVFVRKQAQR